MSYFNHRPSSTIQSVPERRWCCPAHCEEHDRLSIEYRAIDGKVAALRNKAVRSNGIRNLFTIQEVSAALDGIHEVIDAIDGGITTAKTFHDKFCQEHVTKDVHITTINELKAQRVHTLQVMFELYKKLRSLDSADDRSIVTQPPQYTPVDKTVLPNHGCSTQPSSSRTPLMDQGSDYSSYDSTDNRDLEAQRSLIIRLRRISGKQFGTFILWLHAFLFLGGIGIALGFYFNESVAAILRQIFTYIFAEFDYRDLMQVIGDTFSFLWWAIVTTFTYAWEHLLFTFTVVVVWWGFHHKYYRS